ncbi:MAG: hypothetical protein QGG40_17360 [Myxococcota bacterium]|nr:hypothetical protein [Myxococcota bacterium]
MKQQVLMIGGLTAGLFVVVGSLQYTGQLAGYTPTGRAAGSPADAIPMPRPEACLEVFGEPEEGEMIAAVGLDYLEVKQSLDGVLQHALYCRPDEGTKSLNMVFDINVGCDGVVQGVYVDEDDGASERYTACVASVLERADFPGHDMPDGMDVIYPVNVNW